MLSAARITLSLSAGDPSYLAQRDLSLPDDGYQSGQLDRRVPADLVIERGDDIAERDASPEPEAEPEPWNRYGDIMKKDVSADLGGEEEAVGDSPEDGGELAPGELGFRRTCCRGVHMLARRLPYARYPAKHLP